MTKINYQALIEENYANNFSGSSLPQNFSVGIYNQNDKFFSSYTINNKKISNNQNLNKNSLFRIASITKTFIATAILQLRDLGRLTLDDPILIHMPDFTVVNSTSGKLEKVTIKRMLTHYSGLPTEHNFNNWETKKFITKNELLDNLSEIDIVAEQDVQWKYSNLAYSLLGILIEKITQMPLDKYIKDEILKPLGLKNTFFYPSEDDKKNLISGNKYSFKLNKLIKEDFIEMHSMVGAGGLFSCTEDILNWILFQLPIEEFSPGKILDPDSLFEMHMPIYISDNWEHAQAYGWRIFKNNNNNLHIHGGGIYGYSSNVVFSKKYNCGLVVLSNLWPNNFPNDFSISLINTIIENQNNNMDDKSDNNIIENHLQDIFGTYFAEPGLYLDLTYSNGDFWLINNDDFNKYKMHAPSKLSFVGQENKDFIVSSGRAKGEVIKVLYEKDLPFFILGGFKYTKL